MVVLLAFNALGILGAIVCAHRSYRRYGNPVRAVVADVGVLLVLPLIVVGAVSAATPSIAYRVATRGSELPFPPMIGMEQHHPG